MNNILVKTFLLALLAVQSSSAMAYQVNVADFSADGTFSYPDAQTQADGSITFTNFETVEYIYAKKAWNNSAKSLLGNYRGQSFEYAKYLYVTSLLSDFDLDASVPAPHLWPIPAGQLAAAVDGTAWPPANIAVNSQAPSLTSYKFNGTKLRAAFGDWRKRPNETKGAKISLVDDNESDTRTLNSEGALILPFAKTTDVLRTFEQTVRLPYIQWKIKDVSSGDDDDIEELRFGYGVSRLKDFPQGSAISTLEYGANAYYQTDLDFEGELIGIDITSKPVFELLGVNVGSSEALFEESVVSYLLEIEPKLSYNKVLTGSPFINREEDDTNFSAGFSVSMGIQPFGYARARQLTSNWGLGLKYEYLNDLSDSDQDSTDLFTASVLYWLSDRTALNIEYQNGETESTNKPIDQITFGLEIKL